MKTLVQTLVFFVVVLYSSYAFLFFFNTGVTGFKPLYWHFFIFGTVLVLIILRLPMGLPSVDKHFTIWLWAFLSNSIISFFYSSQGDVAVDDLIKTFQITLLFFSFVVLFRTTNAIRISSAALLLVVLFSVSMNFIDFFTPIWSKVPGRGAGFYENPTIAGKMLVFSMVLSIPIIPKKFRVLYCSFVGVGVFITFSRGPWLLWAIALAGLAGTKYLEIGNKGISVAVASALAGFLIYSALTGGILGFMSDTGFSDYLTPGTTARLGGSGGAFTDYSTTSRAEAAAKAWAVFEENPWFGAGLAHDQEWVVGAHNTYLRMAAEGGVVRLAIFIGLLVVLWRMTDSIGRVTLIVYAASSMTAQDNLRAPALLLILALIAARACSQETRLNSKSVDQCENGNVLGVCRGNLRH